MGRVLVIRRIVKGKSFFACYEISLRHFSAPARTDFIGTYEIEPFWPLWCTQRCLDFMPRNEIVLLSALCAAGPSPASGGPSSRLTSAALATASLSPVSGRGGAGGAAAGGAAAAGGGGPGPPGGAPAPPPPPPRDPLRDAQEASGAR